jgi:hypothetical protein
MVGLPCLLSQCAKLHVTGWTWAVFTRVYLESCISLSPQSGNFWITLLCLVSSLIIQAKLTQPTARTRGKVAVGSDRLCSSSKRRTFSILCDLMKLWDFSKLYPIVTRRMRSCRPTYWLPRGPCCGGLIKLEMWLHADGNYNPLTYYLAVSISLMMDWMPFLAYLRQNNVNINWAISLKLHSKVLGQLL